MNVPQEQLDRWRAFVSLVRNTAISARLCFATGKAEQARAQLQALHDAAIVTAAEMEQAGASRPSGSPAPPDVPLKLLSTDTSRAYARALRAAYDLARAVDQERGYGDDGPADFLLPLVTDAELDAFGPAGRLPE